MRVLDYSPYAADCPSRQLLDRIGDPDAPITSRVFPPKLIPRAST